MISCPSLWTDLRCNDLEKTLVYLQRSGSSAPVNVSLSGYWDICSGDPFFQVIPRVTGRLKSLSIDVMPDCIDDIAASLSSPEPLLEKLEITIDTGEMEDEPPELPSLFADDLSSLHDLILRHVHTDLPWRDMANLTTFKLWMDPPDVITITQLLDFFEAAPRLREIELTYATPTFDGRKDRLVSLTNLKKMTVKGCDPCAPLLGHLLIPIDAKLEILSESEFLRYEDLIPESLDNLGNLSNFATASLHFYSSGSSVQFSGPSGELSMVLEGSGSTSHLSMALDYMARFGLSTVEKLRIIGDGNLDVRAVHRALPPMQGLRTLTLFGWENQCALIETLSPHQDASSAVICPKLEELAFRPHKNGEKSVIQCLIGVATSRALRGVGFKNVKIFGARGRFDSEDVLELGKYVPHVEYDVGTSRIWGPL